MSSNMRILSIWPAFVLLAMFPLQAPGGGQPGQPQAIDVEKLGPQVGQQIPDFRLQDQNGKTWTPQSVMGPKGAMLVFFRSADWWPYCKTQLVELQGRLGELKKQGLGLAAISYDSPAILADFTARRGITFPLLSDSGSETIKKYGILNTTVAPTTSNYGIPFPGTFMLNPRGVVTARFFESAYQERNTVSTILLNLGAGGNSTTAATRHTTDHLEMTTSVSDQTIAPGTVFSLVLEIKPRAGMHVYAPGAAGYKVIALSVEPMPWLKLRPVQFPASEIYVFKPLNERVPVYQKSFRLVQELNLDASREAQAQLATMKTLTIKGTVDYQACDDKVCFNPASVPVSWTVNLRTVDTDRANVQR